MYECKLYIGSNNTTHKLEGGKIAQIASRHFDGFTLQPGLGFWKGQHEKSAVLTILVEDTVTLQKVRTLKVDLLRELSQECIPLVVHEVSVEW